MKPVAVAQAHACAVALVGLVIYILTWVADALLQRERS